MLVSFLFLNAASVHTQFTSQLRTLPPVYLYEDEWGPLGDRESHKVFCQFMSVANALNVMTLIELAPRFFENTWKNMKNPQMP
jgi:hypothetical protein